MSDKNEKTAKLSVTEKVGYGFGDLASNLFWQMFAIFIAKFYTDVFLLSAATMGTMLLVTRMFDSVTDPLMGTIADRTRTRWGKFRPYLIWMSLPMAVTAVLTFTVPGLDGTAKIVYAYVTMSLMMLAYTAINIPYSALLGVLTPDSRDRTSASSYRFVMALLPVFIIVNTAIPLVEYFGNGDANSPRGWQMTMIIYSTIAVLLFWATFALTRERVQPPPEQRSELKADLRNLLRNRPWVVLSAVGIAALTYVNIRSTVAIYYFEYTVPNGKDLFGPIMTTGAAGFIAGVMVTAPLSKIFGKRNFYIGSMGLAALLTIGFYYVPTDNVPLVWTVNTLINFVAAPTAPLVWAMYADSADYSEWRFGRRATGLVFSAASFAQKLGWAIGGAGTGWLLSYFAYTPNVAQTPETIDGLKLMMSYIPAAGALLAVAALWFYPLDEKTVENMTRELEERRAREPGALTSAEASPRAAEIQAAFAAQPVAAFAWHGATGTTEETAMNASVKPASAPSAPQQPGWAEQAQGEAATAAPGLALPPPPLPPRERRALDRNMRDWLERGIHGLCFSPYVEGQAPGTQLGAEQIRARLQVIRPHTRWVRTFSCTDGHELTPGIAHELGLKTMVGAWLGRDAAINEREIEGLIQMARAGHVDIAAVGNEVLLREDLSEDELIAQIERVKGALPGVPVGYVDAYFLFEKHPRVTAACDVILVNCYPFWEGCPREQALPYMQTMVERARAAAPGKQVIVSETGWPDRGSAFHAAVPSVEGAMQYFVETMNWAERERIEVFWFAAYDEAWKVGAEGDVGAYWGLWDKDARPKFVR